VPLDSDIATNAISQWRRRLRACVHAAGQSEGSMNAGVSFFNSSIVIFARRAGALSC